MILVDVRGRREGTPPVIYPRQIVFRISDAKKINKNMRRTCPRQFTYARAYVPHSGASITHRLPSRSSPRAAEPHVTTRLRLGRSYVRTAGSVTDISRRIVGPNRIARPTYIPVSFAPDPTRLTTLRPFHRRLLTYAVRYALPLNCTQRKERRLKMKPPRLCLNILVVRRSAAISTISIRCLASIVISYVTPSKVCRYDVSRCVTALVTLILVTSYGLYLTF